jgi:hypothetical protein
MDTGPRDRGTIRGLGHRGGTHQRICATHPAWRPRWPASSDRGFAAISSDDCEERLGRSGGHGAAVSRRHEELVPVSAPSEYLVGDMAGGDLGRVDDGSEGPEVLLHSPVAVRDALTQTLATRPSAFPINHPVEVCPQREQVNRGGAEVAGAEDVEAGGFSKT